MALLIVSDIDGYGMFYILYYAGVLFITEVRKQNLYISNFNYETFFIKNYIPYITCGNGFGELLFIAIVASKTIES